MKTTIILIRHAQADGNVRRIFQGRYDGKVSELGYRQLSALSKRCEDFSFAAAYSSPLSRAVETAKAAVKHQGLPVVTLDGLLEISGGDWEGKPWDTFPQSDPEQNDNWYHHPSRFQAPGGEPMRHVMERMVSTMEEIVRRHPGGTVCVVSHGCAIGCYMNWALGHPFEELSNSIICDNTAINVIYYDEAMHPTVTVQNDTSHLDASIHTSVSSLWAGQKEEKTR